MDIKEHEFAQTAADEFTLLDLRNADDCARAGVRRVLVTGTRRDGSLAGPDLELLAEVVPAGMTVLAAGGVGSIGDLIALKQLGCEGAVVGSALLRGAFTLADALAATVES